MNRRFSLYNRCTTLPLHSTTATGLSRTHCSGEVNKRFGSQAIPIVTYNRKRYYITPVLKYFVITPHINKISNFSFVFRF